MASQSLYRKWRSQTFSDLKGQEAIVRTLLNAVREGRLAHAYLFCGPRGIGKTSAARLLAKAINCANPKNGEPCNECVSCVEIAEGRSPDVIEIDAASNRGIDDIRGIQSNAGLVGTAGRYKVYVVDECHMLTPPAWNAFLKTLEEPPPHVIFVLATTDPHSVLPTVISRCQRFDFRRFTVVDIIARLEHVASGEGLALEPAAAELLARTAQGGMRDALSLLDQAVAFCGNAIDIERVRAMLGLSDVTALRRLISCVADDQAADGLEIINDLVATGADLRQLNSQLAEEWRALLLASAGGDLTRLMEYGVEEARELGALSKRFTMDQLIACARAFTRNSGPARGLPVPQLALELSFLECVSIRRGEAPGATVSAPPSASTTAPAVQSHQPTSPSPRVAPPVAPVARTPQRPVKDLDLAAIDAGAGDGPADEPAPALVATSQPASLASIDNGQAAPKPAQEPEAPLAPPPPDGQDWAAEARRQWALIRKICKQKTGVGSTVYGLLNDAEALRCDPGSPPTLILAARHEFHLKSLREDPKREIVEWALEQALGTPMRVRFVAAGEGQPGMAAAPARASLAPSRAVDPPPARPVREQAARYGAAPASAANGQAQRPESPPPTRPVASSTDGASSPPTATSLDQAARQDPVVVELVRHGLEVAEVRPLDPELPDPER